MAQLRAQPLVGVVLADNPAIEAQLRAAVEADQRDPQATSRAFLAVSEMRRTIVGPALAAADDASALAVMKARVDLVSHLEKTDLAACRQFSGDGIRDVNKLDDEGQRLFHAMLTTMEAAYRSGKANGKGKPPTNEEFAAMLFVPSIGGISHHFSENTADTDIVLGCQVFADATAKILKGN
ncbi:MAG TPA: hypothetical protein VFF72_11840, partial [Caldimonas sp.]|nr:hypothetical protein [Caldimonas sp.]